MHLWLRRCSLRSSTGKSSVVPAAATDFAVPVDTILSTGLVVMQRLGGFAFRDSCRRIAPNGKKITGQAAVVDGFV